MLAADEAHALQLDLQDNLSEPTNYTDLDHGEDPEDEDDAIFDEANDDSPPIPPVLCKSGDVSILHALIDPFLRVIWHAH